MGDVLVLKGVPADLVEDRVQKYTQLGATNVEKVQENGSFTLKITFPDDDEGE